MPDVDTSHTGWEFAMPSLGADMDSGTIIEWYVKPGGTVERGDAVALVSTEKSDIDIEVWHSGVVSEFLVGVGDHVPVGTPIMRFAGTTADRPDVALAPSQPAPAPEPGVAASPVSAPASPRPVRPVGLGEPLPTTAASSDGLRVSPLARTVAAEHGVDLASIKGSGPGGAILIRDLPQETAAPATEPAAMPAQPAGRGAAMRGIIAERMARANRDIPHYHLELDIDVSGLLARLVAHNETLPIAERILPAAALLKATAAALVTVPELNGTWIDGSFRAAASVDVAVAISLRTGGLVTPTLTRLDQLSLAETMATLRDMVAGARRGSLRSSWMVDAGLTVSNLGDRGADRMHGVVFPPQVGLVGFGRINERPWVVDGAVVPRSTVTASLAADHRCTDGATGSRFLAALSDHIEGMEAS